MVSEEKLAVRMWRARAYLHLLSIVYEWLVKMLGGE